MDIDKLKIANINLSNKLDKVTRERDLAQREVINLGERLELLKKAYQQKMRVGKIVVNNGDEVDYVLQVLEEHQTPDGVFIKGRI